MEDVTMETEEFVRRAKQLLGPELLNQSGAVLYSSRDTLRSGDIYFLGTNPGGDPKEMTNETIQSHLDELRNRCQNAYVHEDWCRGPGKSPMQVNVKKLIKALSLDIQSICASNLIFKRTTGLGSMSGAEFYELAQKCWAVHRLILQVVKPKAIIAFGIGDKSAYSYIYRKFTDYLCNQIECESHYRNWKCKAHRAWIERMEISVIGVPHLSYYNIKGKKDVIQWIRGKIE
jgi:hypothetical protein